jgi:nicotinate-nucleotide pyrophosphorylase (carboxylating)
MLFNNTQIIEEDVKAALVEDLGGQLDVKNDITANLIDEDTQAKARIITREPGILCGQQWASAAFLITDPSLRLVWHKEEGDNIHADDTLLSISGSARSILTAERTALNFLQLLSGTATTTKMYTKILDGCKTNLLDTRKTIPRYRQAQKYAVICGGGVNHRMGLYDAFLIKENHIKACGNIQKAVNKARSMASNKPVEVEVESLEELNQAILAGADTIMLDNFSNEQIREAVAITNGRCKLEVSGNIVKERLHELAQTGVDYVSSGALTKHVKALDLSLLIE